MATIPGTTSTLFTTTYSVQPFAKTLVEDEDTTFTVIHPNNLSIDSTASKTSSVLLPAISSSNPLNPDEEMALSDYNVEDLTREMSDQLEIALREVRESERDQEVEEIHRTTRWYSFSERHGCILGDKGVIVGFMCCLALGLGLISIPIALSVSGK